MKLYHFRKKDVSWYYDLVIAAYSENEARAIIDNHDSSENMNSDDFELVAVKNFNKGMLFTFIE